MTSPIVRSFLERSEKSPLGLFGLDTPSGADRASLKRDLDGGKRILLRRPTVYEIRSIDKKAREVEVVASTSGVKRDGNAIFHSEKAWDFRNFEKNPAMLWSHDYGSAFAPPGLPLGYWKTWGIEKTKASGNALVMRGWFEEDEFPEKVWRRILSGTIRAVSIGWNPLEFEELEDEKGRQVGWNFTLNELYECSWVVIGADPDAGVRGMYADLNQEELDVIANGRRAHELSRGVAYMLDHRDAPEEFVRSIANLPKESEMKTVAPHTHTIMSTIPDPAPVVPQAITLSVPVAPHTLTPDGPVTHVHQPASRLDFGAAFRALSKMVQARGPLSDALDVDYDKLKATHYGMDEPVAQLCWMINALYCAEDQASNSPESPIMVAGRCLNRIRAMLATMGEAVDGIESTLSSAPTVPDSGETEVPEPGDPEMAVAGTAAPEHRVGKKMATKRLMTLKKCREHLDEVIKECEDEECDDNEMASGTPEVAREVAPEVDPAEALRGIADKLERTVTEAPVKDTLARAMLGDLAARLEAVVS